MTNRFDCDDKTRLIAYLYGDSEDGERGAVEAHLVSCARCADELHALGGVRASLAAWQPPAADLGFRIVREPVAATRWWQVPAWAPLAVAAGLVLALAASLEVEYGDGTMTVRSGWARAAGPSPQAPVEQAERAPQVASLTDADLQEAMTVLENRLRTELAASRGAGAAPARAQGAGLDRADLLRQVEQLIEASERRQQRELAFRLAQVVQDMDAQRRTDMVRIENGLGEIEGLTGQEVARQRQLINYLMRTSQER